MVHVRRSSLDKLKDTTQYILMWAEFQKDLNPNIRKQIAQTIRQNTTTFWHNYYIYSGQHLYDYFW